VSGLADGVDFLAHESSLAAGIVNVAVLGEGFLALRTENRQSLAVKIVLSGGAVLSELPPDAPSTAGSFIERDRIIAGLADVLVVAQCGIPSGTLHTVAVAKQLGLPLMVAKLTGDPRLFRGNLHLSGKLQENLSEGEWAALERLQLLDLGDLEVSEFGTAAEFKELMHP
jgi:predicted Rossmann fold nucleotide-binding protein DprA/Smf involved in DNA uptake